MKRLSFIPMLVILVISSVLLISLTAFKKSASSPVQLNISANFINGDNSVGTFSSSGFLNTSGTTAEQVQVNANTFHAQTTFTDGQGTFIARINGSYSFTTPSSVAGTGNWVIISGTGAYNKLHGTGQMTFSADFAAGTINDQWTGDMHIN